MYEDIRQSAEEYFRQGYRLSSIKKTIEDSYGPKVASEVISNILQDKSVPLFPYVKNLRESGYGDGQIRSIFLEKGYDPDIVEYIISPPRRSHSSTTIKIFGAALSLMAFIALFFFFIPHGFEFSGETTDPVSDQTTDTGSAELTADLVEDAEAPGSEAAIRLMLDTSDEASETLSFTLKDEHGYFIEDYDVDVKPGVQAEESIMLPELMDGEYVIEVESARYGLKKTLDLTVTEQSDIDETQREKVNMTSDDEEEDEDGESSLEEDTDDYPSNVTEEMEEGVASMIGETPTNILTEEQIYHNARQMPLHQALEYCQDYPQEIAELCIEQARDVSESKDEDCENVTVFGDEICVSEPTEDEQKDSYCDYIDHNASKETCFMISQEYDGVVDIINDSEMGLNFSLVVLSDGEHRQIDFADPEDEDDEED
ncbi:MAG: hypothetical protein ACLFTR_03240 [Candidatus Woesearchaeota archaeon]